jgi:hypothetical protein
MPRLADTGRIGLANGDGECPVSTRHLCFRVQQLLNGIDETVKYLMRTERALFNGD